MLPEVLTYELSDNTSPASWPVDLYSIQFVVQDNQWYIASAYVIGATVYI